MCASLPREVGHVKPPALWRVELCESAALTERAAELLSDTERRRADQCVPEVRRRRVLLRAALRIALGRWLGRGPQSLQFVTEAGGKPRLDGGGAHFSVSSSGDRGLIAITDLGPVGVDVERLRAMDELDAIALRSFSAEAAREVLGQRAQRKVTTFYRHWTRLEAQLKASGEGLAAGLQRDERERGAWTVAAVDSGSGFTGAVAVGGAYGWSDFTLPARELDLARELARA